MTTKLKILYAITVTQETQDENTNIIKFSVSRFNLQSECLQKYKFKYIDRIKLPETTWASTILGLAFHEMFETAFKQDFNLIRKLQNKKTISKANMLDFFGGKDIFQFFEEEEAKAELEQKKIKINRKWNNKYFFENASEWSLVMFRYIMRLTKGFDDAEPEKQFEFVYKVPGTNDELLLIGFIDLILKRNDFCYIYDYKNTTNPHTYFFVPENDIQSNIYMFIQEYLWDQKPLKFTYLVNDMFSKIIFSKEIPNSYDANNILKAFLLRHKIAGSKPTGAVDLKSCLYCEYKKRCDKRRA